MAKPAQSYQNSVNEIGLAAASTHPSPKGRVKGVGASGSTSNSKNQSRMSGEEGGGGSERDRVWGERNTWGWWFGVVEPVDGWKKR